MTAERLRFLIECFLAGSCTEQDKEELAQAVLRQPAGDKEVLRQALESAWMQYTPDKDMPEEMSDRILRSIIGEPARGTAAPSDLAPTVLAPAVLPSADRPRVLSYRRVWAAAAAILLLSSGAWLLFRLHTPPPAVTAQLPQRDIAPGGSKAILTLGSGQKIILDSASNGVLAQQGNATVTKLTNGQVAYTVASAPNKTTAALFNTMSTPSGGQYRLTLPDGTGVWLNATSSITYPTAFAGKERLVRITGEAYFEVAKNKKMPFLVETGGMKVYVLGTSFNINAYKDEASVNTTLLDGAVKVSNGSHEIFLRPGQQAQADPGSDGPVRLIQHVDTDHAVAWKNGIFSFESADIKTVMRQLARWYNVDVRFEGAPLQGNFSGEIGRSLTLTQVLNGLSQEKIHFKIEEGNKIVIQP